LGPAFINRQHKTAFLTGNAVAGVGLMHHQGARAQETVLVCLGAAQHKNVLMASMLVERHTAAGLETDDGSGRPVIPITIQPVDVNAGMKRLPWDVCLVVGDFEQVLENERGMLIFD